MSNTIANSKNPTGEKMPRILDLLDLNSLPHVGHFTQLKYRSSLCIFSMAGIGHIRSSAGSFENMNARFVVGSNILLHLIQVIFFISTYHDPLSAGCALRE